MSTETLAKTLDAGSESTSRSKPKRRADLLLPAVGVLAVTLSAVALSGVGDAPDPHDPASAVTVHFVAVHDDVLVAAPIGYLGATLMVGFLLGLRHRFVRGIFSPAASVIASSAAVVGLYFAALHVVYTTLAYQIAASSPEAAKAVFVLTILAVPVLGVVVAVLVATLAWLAWRTGSMPRWWCFLSAAGAALSAFAAVSYEDSGFFSPDVQQQVVGNVLFVWILLAAGTLAVRPRRGEGPARPPRPKSAGLGASSTSPGGRAR
jgi:hypothetical protein